MGRCTFIDPDRRSACRQFPSSRWARCAKSDVRERPVVIACVGLFGTAEDSHSALFWFDVRGPSKGPTFCGKMSKWTLKREGRHTSSETVCTALGRTLVTGDADTAASIFHKRHNYNRFWLGKEPFPAGLAFSALLPSSPSLPSDSLPSLAE